MGNSSKQQALFKIRFLEDQLVSLDHYLPEIYDYLIRELDAQKRILAELEFRRPSPRLTKGVSESAVEK